MAIGMIVISALIILAACALIAVPVIYFLTKAGRERRRDGGAE